MQIVRFSKKRYSLIIAAQSLRCGFGKLEVIDFFVRYLTDSTMLTDAVMTFANTVLHQIMI